MVTIISSKQNGVALDVQYHDKYDIGIPWTMFGQYESICGSLYRDAIEKSILIPFALVQIITMVNTKSNNY